MAKAKTESNPQDGAKVDPAVILASFAGQIVPAKDLGAAFRKGGHEHPVEQVVELLEAGKLRQLGNTDLDKNGHGTGFRYAVPKAPKSGKIWVRAIHGPAAVVPGAGKFDRLGRAIESSAEIRELLESRSVPVEVISDPGKVAELEAEAEKRAEAKAKKIDKRAAALRELG